MSVQAIRALILLLNLALLGLIGWVCYGTFVHTDMAKYEVPKLELQKFRVEPIQGNPDQENKKAYEAITRVLDRPPPPKPVEVVQSRPVEQPRADPRQIQVLAIQYSSQDKERSSAYLSAPLANPKDPKFWQTGLDLGLPGLGFEAYKDVKVIEIRENEVVLQDQKGAEVRLPGPRGKEPR